MKLHVALGEASFTPPTRPTTTNPLPGLPQATTSLSTHPPTDHGETEAKGRSEPDDAEYAAAQEILMALPDTEPHMTVGIAELAAAGITDPTKRQMIVRAADVATGRRSPKSQAYINTR